MTLLFTPPPPVYSLATMRVLPIPDDSDSSPVLHFDDATIRARLPWPRMLDALDAALKSTVQAPLRANHAIEVPGEPAASLLLMPAWRVGQRIGVKLVTVFPGNRLRSERAVAAVYALFDARDGTPLALFDGEELTARRTAGASAYAADRLARADARLLVMVGAGRQARGLIEAHTSVRPIEEVALWSRTAQHAEAAAAAMAADGMPVRPCTDLEAAVRVADIVSCATLASAPIVLGAWLRPGTHLDLVGAFKAHMRETDDAAMQRADIIVVDNREAALAEGGDVVQAIASGAISAASIAAELRDFACGAHAGRQRDDQVTVFKSVGFALEDLAAAEDGLRCHGEPERIMTWSIVARDASGALGVAVASRFFAVGALCPHARSGVGALSTQALVNPCYGPRGLDLIESGMAPLDVLASLTDADDGRDHRQLHMVDGEGRVAAHTGAACIDWCGHLAGEGFSVAGNMLTGPHVLYATAAAFAAGSGSLSFAERLLAALDAGDAAGGDKRGKQAAALLIFTTEEYPALDLRVDDHIEPFIELRRLHDKGLERYQPFVACLPTHALRAGRPTAR